MKDPLQQQKFYQITPQSLDWHYAVEDHSVMQSHLCISTPKKDRILNQIHANSVHLQMVATSRTQESSASQ